MEKKTIENINIAKDLYGKGYSGKEIAERMGVSEATVSVWRAKSKELGIEWKYEGGAYASVTSWIEEKIRAVMRGIDDAGRENAPTEHLYGELDSLVTIRKKYEDGTDTYGETVRVMEKFGAYVGKHHKDVKDIVKEAVTSFMQSVAR